MTDKIKYGPWIDNEGVKPEFEDGQKVKVMLANGRELESDFPFPLNWEIIEGNSLNILKYCIELSPEISQETDSQGEWSNWIKQQSEKCPVGETDMVKIFKARSGMLKKAYPAGNLSWASGDRDAILAYCTRKPEVKVNSSVFAVTVHGHSLSFYTLAGKIEEYHKVEVSCTTTDGKRSWEIEEVKR